jgi:regulator of replication initiation timing
MNNETQHTAEWIINYDKANHQSSAGKAIRYLMQQNEKLTLFINAQSQQLSELHLRIASAPSLLKENQELKAENERLRDVFTSVLCRMKNNGMNAGHWKKDVQAMSAVLNGREYVNPEVDSLKSINEELIKALEHARTYMREFGCTDEHLFLKIDNALNNAK